jgi:hypothetical protein
LARSAYRKAPRYVVFSTPLLPSPSYPPNIFLSTLFSNTLSLCSSLSVSNQFSYPLKAKGKIILQLKCGKISYRNRDILRKEFEVWTKCLAAAAQETTIAMNSSSADHYQQLVRSPTNMTCHLLVLLVGVTIRCRKTRGR